ncbi:ABC transporter ATP-binding protein [Candidatus Woesearchaeota archaeon]|nr:ABC transporter ATP-binding protein [Candidatus Woesearchaeota archaeon]
MSPQPRNKTRYKLDMKYTLKVLWSFVRKYKLALYTLIGIIIIGETVHFADKLLFKYIVDKAMLFSGGGISGESFMWAVVAVVLALIGFRLVDAILWFLRLRKINYLEANIMSDIEQKSFWHVINLSYRFHVNKRTGSLISQFTRGVHQVEPFADSVLFNFIPVVVQLALSVGVIIYFDFATSMALLLMCVVFVLAGAIATHIQKEPQEEANENDDNLKHNLSDIFLNIETVKYFAKERLTFNYFARLSSHLKESRQRYWNIFSWTSLVEVTILGLGMGAIIYFSFSGFKEGRLTLGSVTLMYTATLSMIPMLYNLMHGYRNFVRSSVDVSDLFNLYKESNEVKDIEHATELKVTKGGIIFDQVSFSYPKEWKKPKHDEEALLHEFSLDVKPNTKVALVGPSGSGKTTVVKLLYRLFEVSSGNIYLDGQDINEVTQRSLRESMSVVPQEPILFNNSIYFNVAYANPRAGKTEVMEAIRMAHLDQLVERLPQKEQTQIGERGVKLSGGEKQRVSIARALLANKKLLILDEATSSLDSETEKDIQNELEVLKQGRTTIMIAHRLSTIMNADKIVVLDQGRIVEQGTHEQLLQKPKGLYRKLWGLQQGGG